MEKEIPADSSLDEKPIAYVRMYLDDLPLPCNEEKATICPLTPFIEDLSSQILISSERLKEACHGIESFEQSV